jgi:hypothetical protein
MAGMLNDGFVGRGLRLATGNPIKKKLFGEKGTDFLGIFAKDPVSPYEPTITPTGKKPANKKGVRKQRAPRVDSVLSSPDAKQQYDLIGGK